MRQVFALLSVCFLVSPTLAQKGLNPEVVPTFQIRARVLSAQGKAPTDKKFSFRLDAGKTSVKTVGTEWSDWLTFGRPEIEKNLKGYPAIYMRRFPVVLRLIVGGVVDPTRIEAELKFDETKTVKKLTGELFGSRLGVMIWREEKTPMAATMAEYNRRYWDVLKQVDIPENQRPKLFPIVDRFIGGDDDRIAWKEGIQQLSGAGFSAIMLPPSEKIRQLLTETGLKKTSWAVYNPPGYAFDFDEKITSESIQQWADKIADQYKKAGYSPKDMAMFAMSDEPGWYYPQMLEKLKASPEGMDRFHDYLQQQKLTPDELGHKSWKTVMPIGRSQAKDLPSRKLFYWSMRFFPYDSSKHFAASTKALENAFYPGLPILTNWNFFSGRLYVPGPVANNRDKMNPDAAMGGHDWFEFGRLRGGTMLWTEDWFPDSKAYQWSFYCARLRCAAAKSGVQFGGYVIPRTAGGREDGILQRILCIVGSGGKAVKYFVFGPEYNFPGNCYSERVEVLPKMAEAHRIIGSAEELLWHGKRPPSKVAILAPRSSQLWDAQEIDIPRVISDATNSNMNARTVDYMAEVFNLYLALQHANIPVDFIDEDDLTDDELRKFKVIYVTEPNVPREGQQNLAQWTKNGGTLVTVTNAITRDRYNEPEMHMGMLMVSIGVSKTKRTLVGNTNALKASGKVQSKFGEFTAYGPRSLMDLIGDGKSLIDFDKNHSAMVHVPADRGSVVRYSFFPGLSYWNSSTSNKDGLPVGFSRALREAIVYPVRSANVQSPVEVDRPLVETPLLLSEKGAAMTLLNWTGEPIDALRVSASLPFRPKRIESVRHGNVPFTVDDGRVAFSVPLKSADVVQIWK